jgi:putative transposase
MPLSGLRPGCALRMGAAKFFIRKKLAEAQWQLENADTGEWCTFAEQDLLDQFTRNELTFERNGDGGQASAIDKAAANLARDLSSYSPDLVDLAQTRVQYLKEIDRRQPMAITRKGMEPLIRLVAEEVKDAKPPGWRTLARDYNRWRNAGRDIRSIISRFSDRGRRGSRMQPEVRVISDQVIEELYMTAERKRVPEVHLEIVRRVSDRNKFRPENESLPIPSQSTIYREIARKPAYEIMAARYGKRRAEMEFRISGAGPETTRALQRISMDHTPSDMIVVDDNSMLPLGRPTITSALDEHTRCPMGFYMGFEPPSCLSVMRCLKHAILPKTYVTREFPSIKNRWECYGTPELVVVDNPPEFHSSHFERACLQIGIDIQYAKVLVPWYKGKLERFQGTMNHDLMHGTPGTTFSNIVERDDYDPSRHAVVLLSTFREMLHKWIIDVYLETPHRGIKDTPAHRWRSEMTALPPPLPMSAGELDVVLGMTVQRVVFHYGIELEGLKYNSPELGELRRRSGPGVQVELTFDPGDLGQIHVFDSLKETYLSIPAVDQAYAKGVSLWQHKVIRHYAQRQLNARTDIVALAEAKAEIRRLVERDFNRKSTRGRKRHARFMADHSNTTISPMNSPTLPDTNSNDFKKRSSVGSHTLEGNRDPEAGTFSDEAVLPVFEADFDLPLSPVHNTVDAADASIPEAGEPHQ